MKLKNKLILSCLFLVEVFSVDLFGMQLGSWKNPEMAQACFNGAFQNNEKIERRLKLYPMLSGLETNDFTAVPMPDGRFLFQAVRFGEDSVGGVAVIMKDIGDGIYIEDGVYVGVDTEFSQDSKVNQDSKSNFDAGIDLSNKSSDTSSNDTGLIFRKMFLPGKKSQAEVRHKNDLIVIGKQKRDKIRKELESLDSNIDIDELIMTDPREAQYLVYYYDKIKSNKDSNKIYKAVFRKKRHIIDDNIKEIRDKLEQKAKREKLEAEKKRKENKEAAEKFKKEQEKKILEDEKKLADEAAKKAEEEKERLEAAEKLEEEEKEGLEADENDSDNVKELPEKVVDDNDGYDGGGDDENNGENTIVDDNNDDGNGDSGDDGDGNDENNGENTIVDDNNDDGNGDNGDSGGSGGNGETGNNTGSSNNDNSTVIEKVKSAASTVAKKTLEISKQVAYEGAVIVADAVVDAGPKALGAGARAGAEEYFRIMSHQDKYYPAITHGEKKTDSSNPFGFSKNPCDAGRRSNPILQKMTQDNSSDRGSSDYPVLRYQHDPPITTQTFEPKGDDIDSLDDLYVPTFNEVQENLESCLDDVIEFQEGVEQHLKDGIFVDDQDLFLDSDIHDYIENTSNASLDCLEIAADLSEDRLDLKYSLTETAKSVLKVGQAGVESASKVKEFFSGMGDGGKDFLRQWGIDIKNPLVPVKKYLINIGEACKLASRTIYEADTSQYASDVSLCLRLRGEDQLADELDLKIQNELGQTRLILDNLEAKLLNGSSRDYGRWVTKFALYPLSAEGLINLGVCKSFNKFASDVELLEGTEVANETVGGCKWSIPEKGKLIDGRWYTQHALERMAPDTLQVRAILENRALKLGFKPGSDSFLKYVDPRGIPPSVVENAIQSGIRSAGKNLGTLAFESSDIKVIINEASGAIITIIPK